MQITPLQEWIGIKIGANPLDYTRERLDQWQLDHIQKIIDYVKKNSPFYRQLYAKLPSQPETVEEFSLYPFTTADDLTRNSNQFVCVPQDEIQRIVTLNTSGTSGASKRIFFSEEDQELTIDFFRVGMSTLAAPGDRVLILLPCQRPGSVGDLLRTALNRFGCIPFPHGPYEDEEGTLAYIRENEINVMVGSPVQLHRLARMDQACRVLHRGQVQKVLASTDILPETIRRNLASLWECEVFNHYGMTETGLGGGVECTAHCGFHLRESDLFYEIIDPKTGKNMPEGSTGEVVVTTLTRSGMPLVRYRTGDLSRIITETCACGSFIKRLDKIRGRMNGDVCLSSGKLVPSELDEVLLKLENVLDFSTLVERHPAEEILSINLQLVRGVHAIDIDQVTRALREIPSIEDGLRKHTLQIVIKSGSINAQNNTMSKRCIQVSQSDW